MVIGYSLFVIRYSLYCFRLHRNDLTAENTEDTEGENRVLNNSDATGFDIIGYSLLVIYGARSRSRRVIGCWLLVIRY